MGSSGGGGSSSSGPTQTAKQIEKLRLVQEQALQPFRLAAIQALFNPKYASAYGVSLPTPEEALALSQMSELADLSDLKLEAQRNFERFTVPSLTGQMSAMGFGRSGAVADVLSQAGQQMTMPLLQMSRDIRQNIANYISSVGQRKIGAAVEGASSLSPLSGQNVSRSSSGGGFNPMPFIGGGLSLLGGLFSSKRYKDVYRKVKPSEALKALRSANIYEWKYKDIFPDQRVHFGPVVEELPDRVVDREKGTINLIDYMGLHTAALKALDQKINRMKEAR